MNYFMPLAMGANKLDPTDPNILKAIAGEMIKSNSNFAVSENSSENSTTPEDLATVQAIPKKTDAPSNSGVLNNLSASKNLGVSKNTNVPNEINIVSDLINNNLVQGFIMSEILGSPKAKKSRGNTIWKSRF